MRRRGHSRVLTLQDCVRLGEAKCVYPTTDTGYKSYGAGRLFLPAATNLCTDPQGALANGTFWPASTANTTITANQTPPIPVPDNPQIVKCLKFANNGTADAPVTANLTVVASTSYVSAIYVYAPTLGGNLTITTETGTSTSLAALTAANTGWVRYSLVKATAVGEVIHALKFTFAGGTASEVYVTGDDLVAGTVVAPHFDGSHPGCAWTGTAHASTSTRTVSALAYTVASMGGFTMPTNAYTVAMRWASLAASGSQPANWYLFDVLSGAHEAAQLADFWGGGYLRHGCYDGVNNPTNPNLTFTWTAGGLNSLVARNGGGFLDYHNCGVTRAQAADTTTRTAPATICVGSSNGTGSACHIGYIGPLVVSPSRITDAETLTVDAMLTAGATGLDLFRWFRNNGYPGTLILPLDNDSVGYVVR